MTLKPETQLGPYEIVSAIGANGCFAGAESTTSN